MKPPDVEYGQLTEARLLKTFFWITKDGTFEGKGTIGDLLKKLGGKDLPSGAETVDRMLLFNHLASHGWELIAASPGVATSEYFFRRVK